jgi:hypothetical protein
VKVQFSRLAAIVAASALILNFAGVAAASGPAALTLKIAVTTVGPTSSTGNAHVRVVHGSPDAPQVDVYAGATLGTAAKVAALSGLSFGDVSAYVNIPAGTYAIKVCATANASVCPIQVPSLALAAETYYTIAASKPLASITATVFTDMPAPSGQGAQVRVYHLSSDTPAVDVLTSTGADINAGLDNLAYPNATGYLTLPANTYSIEVCAHADHSVCPFKDVPLTLAADNTYSIFAIGSLMALLATPPPTSTVAENTTPVSSGSPLAIVLLALALVVGAAGTLRFAAVRNRR